ncbi:hypothetical protein CO692_13130 [Enterococcus sp. FDAARGOS_375]|nr:hypothetical protein CO692_13130 [Enterococcus sp. FDAARGOS_375]
MILRKTLFIFKQKKLDRTKFFLLFNKIETNLHFQSFFRLLFKYFQIIQEKHLTVCFFLSILKSIQVWRNIYVKNNRIPTTEYLLL